MKLTKKNFNQSTDKVGEEEGSFVGEDVGTFDGDGVGAVVVVVGFLVGLKTQEKKKGVVFFL